MYGTRVAPNEPASATPMNRLCKSARINYRDPYTAYVKTAVSPFPGEGYEGG